MLKVAIFILSFVVGSETKVVGPRNAAINVGQRMELKCQVDSNWTVREWSIQRTLTRTREGIVSNWNNRNIITNVHFGVDINDFGSAGVLYVNSVTLEDAGIYICAINQGTMQPEKYSAHLIVFETEPVCSSNSVLPLNPTKQEETYVWMRCTVNFRGNLVPNIEWRQHEGYGEEYEKNREITKLADTVIIPNSSITSDLTVVLTSVNTSLSYSFTIYFKSTNDTQMTTATNAPNYSYTWKTPVVVVIPSTHSPIGLTAIHTSIIVLSIVAGAVAITVCVCIRRNFKADSPKKTEETNEEPDDCKNVTIHQNPTVGDSQAATYMELTSLTQASQSVYTNLDIAGRKLAMPRTPSPVYENFADKENASS